MLHVRLFTAQVVMMLASMVLLVLSRNGVLFLCAWEVMSLSAWVLVSFEHPDADARRAGWVYLVATHLGAAALIVMFMLLWQSSEGSLDFFAGHVFRRHLVDGCQERLADRLQRLVGLDLGGERDQSGETGSRPSSSTWMSSG